MLPLHRRPERTLGKAHEATARIGSSRFPDRRAPVLAAPQEAALGLRKALVEILKQLNRDEMEEPEGPGLEVDELRELLARVAFPLITRTETRTAVHVLVRNGYARELTDERYAWSRGRMVGNRYTITSPGKAFLLRAIYRADRIGGSYTAGRPPGLSIP
jgi:hypothetical protein